MLRIAHDPCYAHPLPPNHRFPMVKYELIPEQLIYEGTASPEDFFKPPEVAEEVILWTHEAEYWRRLKNLELSYHEERRTGFPHSELLIHRERVITQGTILCTQYALQHGCAINVAGGTHHAYTGRGEGFCLLNDQAVAANYLLHTGQANRILIIDLDVHQGQGTAQIFQQEPQVFTFSMHGADNYPLHKEESNLDIALPRNTGDAAYMQQLQRTLPGLIDRHQPDFCFYLSGADVIAEDKLGKLGLSMEGVRRRDHFVLGLLHQKGLPVAISMGGGYAPRVADVVDAHCIVYRAARQIYCSD
jgi:acetoin utilization deacetylase AcuC-like enzyme